MQKGFSALCSSCVLFVTAFITIIKNTNSASGYFTVHLHVFNALRDRDTQTRPVLELVCGMCLYLHLCYSTRFVLIKDMNILHLSDINSFSFG